MKLNLDTYHLMGENFDGEYPDRVVVEIPNLHLHRIRALREKVEELQVYTIILFDFRPVCFDLQYDDDGEEFYAQSEARIDSSVLVVAKDVFWWAMQIKGSGIRFATDTISIDGRAPYASHNVGNPVPSDQGE